MSEPPSSPPVPINRTDSEIAQALAAEMAAEEWRPPSRSPLSGPEPLARSDSDLARELQAEYFQEDNRGYGGRSWGRWDPRVSSLASGARGGSSPPSMNPPDFHSFMRGFRDNIARRSDSRSQSTTTASTSASTATSTTINTAPGSNVSSRDRMENGLPPEPRPEFSAAQLQVSHPGSLATPLDSPYMPHHHHPASIPTPLSGEWEQKGERLLLTVVGFDGGTVVNVKQQGTQTWSQGPNGVAGWLQGNDIVGMWSDHTSGCLEGPNCIRWTDGDVWTRGAEASQEEAKRAGGRFIPVGARVVARLGMMAFAPATVLAQGTLASYQQRAPVSFSPPLSPETSPRTSLSSVASARMRGISGWIQDALPRSVSFPSRTTSSTTSPSRPTSTTTSASSSPAPVSASSSSAPTVQPTASTSLSTSTTTLPATSSSQQAGRSSNKRNKRNKKRRDSEVKMEHDSKSEPSSLTVNPSLSRESSQSSSTDVSSPPHQTMSPPVRTQASSSASVNSASVSASPNSTSTTTSTTSGPAATVLSQMTSLNLTSAEASVPTTSTSSSSSSFTDAPAMLRSTSSSSQATNAPTLARGSSSSSSRPAASFLARSGSTTTTSLTSHRSSPSFSPTPTTNTSSSTRRGLDLPSLRSLLASASALTRRNSLSPPSVGPPAADEAKEDPNGQYVLEFDPEWAGDGDGPRRGTVQCVGDTHIFEWERWYANMPEFHDGDRVLVLQNSDHGRGYLPGTIIGRSGDGMVTVNSNDELMSVSEAQLSPLEQWRAPRGSPERRPERRQLERDLLSGWGGMGYGRSWERHQPQVDLDNMSYEEILELEARMGVVKGREAKIESVSLLPVGKYVQTGNREEDCPICTEAFVDGDRIKTLPCFHKFHEDEIDKWLLSEKNACPVCKLPIDGDDVVNFKVS